MATASASSSSAAVTERRGIPGAQFVEEVQTYLTQAGLDAQGAVDGERPAWAPLRDNYMLTNPKLKDWDKMPDTVVEDDIGRVAGDSSDDD